MRRWRICWWWSNVPGAGTGGIGTLGGSLGLTNARQTFRWASRCRAFTAGGVVGRWRLLFAQTASLPGDVMPKKYTPPTQEELDDWDAEGAMMGEPLIKTAADWDRLRKEAGIENIDYSTINIAQQVDRLIKRFGYEEAAQVARGTAYGFGVKEEEGPQQDWLEVERLILERQKAEAAKK